MLPEVLAGFDEALLESSRSSMAAIRPDGAILWVNRAWVRFAEENGGEVRYASYYEAIRKPALRSQ